MAELSSAENQQNQPVTSALLCPPLWSWTKKKSQAVLLVYDDRLTNAEIAAKVGVSLRCIVKWKQTKQFVQRLEELQAEWRKRVINRGIAMREKRVENYNRDFEATETILAERGAHESMEGVPGGKTGFIVRDVKFIGIGNEKKALPVYEFDAGLARTRMQLQEQTARELGQWEDKHTFEAPGVDKALVPPWVQQLHLTQINGASSVTIGVAGSTSPGHLSNGSTQT